MHIITLWLDINKFFYFAIVLFYRSRLKKLNEEQEKILQHCGKRRKTFAAPLLVYGPFGTGKTETIAQSSILLASQNKDVRILICCHTNLYVLMQTYKVYRVYMF